MSKVREEIQKLRLRLQQFDQKSSSSDDSSDDEQEEQIDFPKVVTPTETKEKYEKVAPERNVPPILSVSLTTDLENEEKSDTSTDDETSDLDQTETTSIMAFHRQKYGIKKKPDSSNNKLWLKPPSVDSGKGYSISHTPQSVVSMDELPSTSYSSAKQLSNPYCQTVSVRPLTSKHDWDGLVVRGKCYRVLNVLGKGGSSTVYHAYDEETKTCLAIKCVDLADTDDIVKQAYANEIMLLEKLQHSNRVVKMFAYEFVPQNEKLYVVMEKGDTDLATLFKTRKEDHLSEITIAYFWAEMLKAVQVVHQQGIVHSDLKPANFLLVAGHLKLIDFGIANAVPANKTSITKESHMGTLNYMSPEAMSNAGGPYEYKFKVGVKSDVWSLGCILYNMVYGKTPFQHIGAPAGKLMAITNPKYPIEFRPISDTFLMDVMKKCLQRDPKSRPSIEQLLQHPYVANKAASSSSKSGSGVNEDVYLEVAKIVTQHTPKTGARMLTKALAGLNMKCDLKL